MSFPSILFKRVWAMVPWFLTVGFRRCRERRSEGRGGGKREPSCLKTVAHQRPPIEAELGDLLFTVTERSTGLGRGLEKA